MAMKPALLPENLLQRGIQALDIADWLRGHMENSPIEMLQFWHKGHGNRRFVGIYDCSTKEFASNSDLLRATKDEQGESDV